MKFDDDKYVEDYLRTGRFPKIHDDIFVLALDFRDRNVMDFGCCKGLLSKRLATINNSVVGIDANKSYLEKAVHDPKITYHNSKITHDTLPFIAELVKKHKVSLVVARRVMPEICETGGIRLVSEVAKMLHDNFVEYIILEGRKKHPNPTNPLSSIDLEVKVFEPYYQVVKSHKDCRTLKRI